MNNKSINIFIIFFIFLMSPMGFIFYLPAFGAIEKGLHTNTDMMGISLVAYFIGVASSQLIYGTLSDKIGRKNTVLIGYSIFAFASLLCCFANTIHQFIAYRLLQGIGFGCDMAVGTAMLKDMYGFKEKLFFGVISFSGSIFGFATVLFPILGGYLLLFFSWRSIFIFMFFYTLFLTLAIKFFLTETNNNRTKVKITIVEYKKIIFDHRYLFCLLALSLAGATFPIFQMGSTEIIQNQLNFSPLIVAYAIAIGGLSYSIGGILNGFLLQKIRVKVSILVLIIIFASSCFSLFVIDQLTILDIYAITIPSFFIFFACGGLFPNFLSTAILRHSDYPGTCASHAGVIAYLGGTVITFIISNIDRIDLISISIIYTVQLMLIILFFVFSQQNSFYKRFKIRN